MAYQKTEWIAYETLVSADLLNKIEDQLQTVTSNTEMNEIAIQSTDTLVREQSKELQEYIVELDALLKDSGIGGSARYLNPDFNTFKRSGMYYPYGTTCLNYPTQVPSGTGYLYVHNSMPRETEDEEISYVKQVFYYYATNRTFERVLNNNVWSDWVEVLKSDQAIVQYFGPVIGDLNDINKEGFYYAHGSTTNRPITSHSFHIINLRYSDAYAKQVAFQATGTDNRNDIYTRAKVAGTWQPWEKVRDNVYNVGTSIPSGSDLNNYLTYGTYYTSSAAVSNSLINKPNVTFGAGARLTVSAGATGSIVVQRLEIMVGGASSNKTYREFIRSYNSSFSDWTMVQHNLFGTGSPEGVVTAPIGSTYINTSGGSNTTLYVKTSGTGNTGWAAK